MAAPQALKHLINYIKLN